MSDETSYETRLTLFLLSNGDISACNSQDMYEYAWAHGIRPIDESRLKPSAWQTHPGRMGAV